MPVLLIHKAANGFVVLMDARGKLVVQEENRKVVK